MREIICQHFITENGVQKYYKEIAGDSSESKPTAGIIDGSKFEETDTGDIYGFNEKASAWVKLFSLKA